MAKKTGVKDPGPGWPRLHALQSDAVPTGGALDPKNVDAAIALLIRARCQEFAHDSNNPIAALDAFVLAMRAGVYPPVVVLQWLAEGIAQYMLDQGKSTMDTALGLVAKTGGDHPFQTWLLEARDDMVMLDMDRLTYLGATQREAAEMIARRLESEDWNKTQWDMRDLSADTIVSKYSRDPHRIDLDWQPASSILGFTRVNPLKDREWVRSYLARFDSLYMPDKLKSML